MNSKLLSACALAALTVAATATAHAESSEELRKRQKGEHHGYYIGRAGENIVRLRAEGVVDNSVNAEDCNEHIKLAYADGLTDADSLRDNRLATYPGQTGGATKDAGSNTWLLPLGKAKAVCETLATELAFVEQVAALKPYFDLGLAHHDMSVEELSKLGGAEDAAGWDASIAEGQKCHAAADALIAAGIAADRKVVIRHLEPFTLAAFKKDRCQAHIDWATKMKVEVPKFAAERRAKIEAKFKKVGIKGKRLELFAYYDQEWYLPGCERATADPKQLKKQKRLFQWFTGPGGEITIRKYTFKGDNYTTSEKTTYNETQAYKLCR